MKIYAVSDGKLKKSRTAGSQIFSIFNAMFLTLLAIICVSPLESGEGLGIGKEGT